MTSQLTYLTSDHINELKDAFMLFAKEEDGIITVKEIGIIFRSLGLDPSEADLYQMVEEVDTSGKGIINWDQFLSLMRKRIKDTELENDLKEAFKVFDRNDEGVVTATELKHVLISLVSEELTIDEINEMIAQADTNKDGLINYNGFVKMILSK